MLSKTVKIGALAVALGAAPMAFAGGMGGMGGMGFSSGFTTIAAPVNTAIVVSGDDRFTRFGADDRRVVINGATGTGISSGDGDDFRRVTAVNNGNATTVVRGFNRFRRFNRF